LRESGHAAERTQRGARPGAGYGPSDRPSRFSQQRCAGSRRRLAGPAFTATAADIVGITVNRWPHGYDYEYNPLFDPDWDEPDQLHVVGRAQFGRIVIANSDSGAGGLYRRGDRPGVARC
jgi:hypothetical protein